MCKVGIFFTFNVASLRKSERLISSRGHGCFTIPSHGSGRPGLELRTATKLSSTGFEPTAALTVGLRVRRLNYSATRKETCKQNWVEPGLVLIWGERRLVGAV